jgi:hypothetical protein
MLVLVLHAWLAVWIPIRDLRRPRVAGRDAASRPAELRRLLIGLAVLTMLWLEGWLIGLLLVGLDGATPFGGSGWLVAALALGVLLAPLLTVAAIAAALRILRWRQCPHLPRSSTRGSIGTSNSPSSPPCLAQDRRD